MSVKDEGLTQLTVGLCLDFDRRQRLIHEQSTSPRCLMECTYLNEVIRGAAQEIVGDEWQIFLNEIGTRTGYAYSKTAFCETYYKKKKAEVMRNIQKRLHLLDD